MISGVRSVKVKDRSRPVLSESIALAEGNLMDSRKFSFDILKEYGQRRGHGHGRTEPNEDDEPVGLSVAAMQQRGGFASV